MSRNRLVLNQDEWDMYKLDLRYECVVKKLPELSVVRISSRQPSVAPPETAAESSSAATEPGMKRRLSETSPSISRRPSGGSSDGHKRKTRRVVEEEFSSSGDDEDEVDRMMVDDSQSFRAQPHRQSERLQKVYANKEEAKRKRRERKKEWRENNGFLSVVDDEDMMSWSESHPTPKKNPVRAQTTGLPTGKRKGK